MSARKATWKAWALVPGLLLAPLAASAQTAAGEVVKEPSWRINPSREDAVKYYPEMVTDRSISGRVELDCHVAATGRITDCETLREVPYGLGFADASERLLIAKGLFNPKTVNGKAVESRVTVPFTIASPSNGARYVIYEPVFETAPGFEEMTAAWPQDADGEEAIVVLRCSLRANGALSDCVAAGKTTDGFAAAAKRLSSRFRVKVNQAEAVRFANSDVLIPIRLLSPASPEGRKVAVKDPRWITTVKAEKVLAVYPPKAAEAGVRSGRGVADCLVAPDGKLTDCKIAREKPEALGFGASAVAIAQLMQMNPWSDTGRPVTGARIKLPIDFNLSEDPAAAPTP